MAYILIDGADDAIIGYTEDEQTAYCYDKLIDVFIDQGMTPDEAREWIDYNILNGGVPMITIVYPANRDEIDDLADMDA